MYNVSQTPGGRALDEAVPASGSSKKGQSFSAMFGEMFSSLRGFFPSSTTPLSAKSNVNLTNIYVPTDRCNSDTDLEKAVDTVERRFSGKLRVVALFSLLASCVGYYRFFETQTTSTSKIGPTAGAGLDVFGSATLTMLRQHTNRALLSSPTSSNYSISGTEEIAFSQSFNTWEVFPFPNLGRLIVSTTSPLPPGVNLVQSPMRIVNSITVSQAGRFAASDNALYVANSPGGSTIRVLNTETVSNPYVANVINTGDVVYDVHVIGNHLYCAGNDKIIKIFDITQPFSPIPQGEISIPGIGANSIASTGIDEQFGCLTQNGFFCVDASNPSNPTITGNVTGLVGIVHVIAASPGYYYIGSSSGLSIVNTTKSSSPTLCSFLPLSNEILDLKYSNGFCYATTDYGALLVINVQDPGNPLLINGTNCPEYLKGLLQPSDGLMYYIATIGMGIFDLSNQTNPQISASAVFPGNLNLASALQGEYLIFGGGGNINFATRRDSFSFSGTPAGGSQGVYTLLLTATTLSGQVLTNDTQTFELNILPAVVPLSPIPNLIAVVGQVFNAIISSTTFKQVNGAALSYRLECEPASTLSSSVSLNSVSAQFSGIPTEDDVGPTTCTVTASDPYGSSGLSSDFNITVVYGPTVDTILNQAAVIGMPFSYKLTASSKDSSSQFTFTVSNLPPSFILNNNTISGTPKTSDLGIYQIFVTATDQNRVSNTKSFQLNVVRPEAPVFLNPLSSQVVTVGIEFSLAIPAGTAINPSNPNAVITYSASLAGGRSLPSWMSFDGTKLYGLPPSSIIVVGDVPYDIVLKATSNGGQTSASIIFTIIVTGTSLLRSALSYGVPILSITLGLLAARICLYNRCASKPRFICCVNKMKNIFCCCFDEITFFSSQKVLHVGQAWEYTFQTPQWEIDHFTTTYCRHQFPTSMTPVHPYPEPYPIWLTLEQAGDKNFKLITKSVVPELGGTYSFEITAKTKRGYKLETVTLTKAIKHDQRSERIREKNTSGPSSIEMAEQKGEGISTNESPLAVNDKGDRTGYDHLES